MQLTSAGSEQGIGQREYGNMSLPKLLLKPRPVSRARFGGGILNWSQKDWQRILENWREVKLHVNSHLVQRLPREVFRGQDSGGFHGNCGAAIWQWILIVPFLPFPCTTDTSIVSVQSSWSQLSPLKPSLLETRGFRTLSTPSLSNWLNPNQRFRQLFYPYDLQRLELTPCHRLPRDL